MPRAVARAQFELPVRVSLLETDLDATDIQLAETNERLGKILVALVGLLISVTTSAILLVINLAVKT